MSYYMDINNDSWSNNFSVVSGPSISWYLVYIGHFMRKRSIHAFGLAGIQHVIDYTVLAMAGT